MSNSKIVDYKPKVSSILPENAERLKNYVGETILIKDYTLKASPRGLTIAVIKALDKEGNEKILFTTSKIVLRQLTAEIDTLLKFGMVRVKVGVRESKGGRQYILFEAPKE